jgi:hypothetical protein
MMKRISPLLIITALIMLAAHDLVSASQCKSAGPLSEELKKSKAVFTGTVVEITKPRPDEYIERGRVIYEDKLYAYVKFAVLKSWKGVGKGEQVMIVEAEREQYGCGKDFSVGGTYLVYARGLGNGKTKRLWIDCCTRTSRIEAAKEDLRKLETGKARRSTKRPSRRSLTTHSTRVVLARLSS